MGWKLVGFGRSVFVFWGSVVALVGGVAAGIVVGTASWGWEPLNLWELLGFGVGFTGLVCVAVCEAAVVRRDTGGTYGMDTTPLGALAADALREASAVEHLVGVVEDAEILVRKRLDESFGEFWEDVRYYRKLRREERRERKERRRVRRQEKSVSS